MIPKISIFALNRSYRRHGPEFVARLQQQYGDLFYVRPPLPRIPQLYFILEAAETHQLLVRHRPMLEKPALLRRTVESSFGNGLIVSQGDFWRRQRKLMQPAFHHAHLNQYTDRIVTHAQAMLATWQDDQVITIDKAMHALTFTIVMDALFSANATDTTATVQQAMRDLTEGFAAQSRSILLSLSPEWFPWPALNQKRRGARALDGVVQQMIAARQNVGASERPLDLLSTLLFTQDEDTGETMSHRQLRHELVTLYIAGHETTALLLNWTWVLLAQHPDIAAALRSELQTVLGGRPPTFDDLPALKLTKAIIQEVLRLYPPTWFMMREAAANLTIRGEAIPTGSILVFVPYAVHRNNRWYDQPQTFQPSRWLNGLEQSLPKGAYFPFGLGPRVCIGNGFALMEAQLILATIAQRFQLQQLNEAQTGPAILLGFAKPVQMRLNQP